MPADLREATKGGNMSDRIQVNGWEYEIDAGMPGEGENFTICQPGDQIEYLRPFGGPFRVVANDAGVLTLERLVEAHPPMGSVAGHRRRAVLDSLHRRGYGGIGGVVSEQQPADLREAIARTLARLYEPGGSEDGWRSYWIAADVVLVVFAERERELRSRIEALKAKATDHDLVEDAAYIGAINEVLGVFDE